MCLESTVLVNVHIVIGSYFGIPRTAWCSVISSFHPHLCYHLITAVKADLISILSNLYLEILVVRKRTAHCILLAV